MANQLQTLLESSAQWKNVQSDAVRLAKKWERTGLLEGLSKHDKSNMALMLENQAKQLVVETSQTGGGTSSVGSFTAGTGEQWAGVALPLVRKVFGQIAAKDFVSVQPMSLPSGLVFFLDYQYGTSKAISGVNTPFNVGGDVFGNGSTYGVTNAAGDPTDGLYGAGRFTYSTNNTSSTNLGADIDTASWADFNFDSNFSASATQYRKVTVTYPVNSDFKAVRGFLIASGSDFNEANNLPVFTKVVNAASRTVSHIITGSLVTDGGTTTVSASFQLQPTDQFRGDFEDNNTGLNANNATSAFEIPEINVKLKSEAIVAKTKKLKAVWTPEFAQDLNAYQNLDAEAELTSIMSEYISMEIDLELLDMLIGDALTTEQW
jgi:hypothetical protein